MDTQRYSGVEADRDCHEVHILPSSAMVLCAVDPGEGRRVGFGVHEVTYRYFVREKESVGDCRRIAGRVED